MIRSLEASSMNTSSSWCRPLFFEWVWQYTVFIRWHNSRHLLINIVNHFWVSSLYVRPYSRDQTSCVLHGRLECRLSFKLFFLMPEFTSAWPLKFGLEFLIKVAFLDPACTYMQRWVLPVAISGCKLQNSRLGCWHKSVSLWFRPELVFMILYKLVAFPLVIKLSHMWSHIHLVSLLIVTLLPKILFLRATAHNNIMLRFAFSFTIPIVDCILVDCMLIKYFQRLYACIVL